MLKGEQEHGSDLPERVTLKDKCFIFFKGETRIREMDHFLTVIQSALVGVL